MSANDYDEELYQVIRDLVDDGELDEESDAYGIAMQVVHRGHGSLSERQSYVYRSKVEAALERRAPVVDYDPPDS